MGAIGTNHDLKLVSVAFESKKSMENIVVGDWLKLAGAEKKVRIPRTARTAWRHIGYRQAPYQRCEGCSGSPKMLFFVLFVQQEPPSGSTVPPGATSSLLGTRRHHFSSLRSFHKTAVPGSLTVRYR